MNLDSLPLPVRQYFSALQHSTDGAVGGRGWRSGEAGRVRLGTQVRWWLQVQDGQLRAARFQAYGCPYTLAACEWLAGELERQGQGQSIGALAERTGDPRQWAQVLEIPSARLGRLLVVEDALRAALADSAVTQPG